MRKRLTKEEFVEKATEVHNGKYDYSLVNYKNKGVKVKIICPFHGVFEQSPKYHLKGYLCPYCSPNKKLNTELFITKAREKHGDRYDYSKVIYINSTTKIEIVCRKHGSFFQRPAKHLCGNGCAKCYNESVSLRCKMSKDEFVKKATAIHGDKYDYSLVVYKNNSTPVKIICPIHGVFKPSPNNHLSGCECPLCARIEAKNKTSLSSEEFIKKSIFVHGDRYDYSIVEYKNYSTNVVIICKKHGCFEITPVSHLSGSGCKKCLSELRSERNSLKIDDFLKRATNVHGNKYDYSKSIYTRSRDKIEIICLKHGSFWQDAASHMNGSGCPKCKNSEGGAKIRNYFVTNNFIFQQEFRIKGCKNKRPLPFDFAIFEDKEKTKLKCLIEFDGEQHYKICKNFKMSNKDLSEIQRRDKIKTDYCLQNNIKLIRIPYWEKNNIEKILSKELTIK